MSQRNPKSPGELTALASDTSAAPPVLSARLRKARVQASLFRKPPEPIKVGRFILLERIGAGRMGEVYAAYDERLDRRVAIKLVRTGADSDADPTADERLLREARVLAKLSHPNVVQIYDAGWFEGRVFIAMEFVRGKTLRQWLETVADLPRRSRQREVLRCLISAGHGLNAAHSAGLVHRDVKPNNILIGDDSRVRVLDFGLARSEHHNDESAPAPAGDPTELAESASGDSLTPRDAVMGTPAYMAPQLFCGAVADHLSDQFSFCITAYEALCGERPYRRTSFAALHGDLESSAIASEVAGADIPAPARKALARGLAPKPKDRFPDMAKLLAALEEWPRRRRWRWVAAAALIAALAGALLYSRAGSEPICETADREIATVWNDHRRAAIERAMTGAGQTYAEEAWPLAATTLDRYAKTWKALHKDACMAHREGRQSDVMLDKRMACLARRRTAMSNTIAVLTETDADSLLRVMDAAKSLPALDRCGNLEALASDVPPPDDPVTAERVRELRAQISRARALHGAGRFAEARELAMSAALAADQVAYEPVLAEALLMQGRATMELGSRARKQSLGPLERAVQVALRAGQHALAVEAFARLVYSQGTDPKAESSLLEFAPMMEALSVRLPERTFVQALLFNNIGTVHLARRDRDRAREYFERAVEIHESDPTVSSLELILARQNLAMLTPRPDQRSALMSNVAARLEGELGKSHPTTLRQRTHWGSFVDNPKKAYDALLPACTRYQRYFVDTPDGLLRCLYTLGFLAADLGDNERAAQHLAELAKRADSLPKERSARDLALGYASLFGGEAEAAHEHFVRAIASLPVAPDKWWAQKRHADAQMGLGLAERARGRHAAAIPALEGALAIYQTLIERTYNSEYRKRLAWTRAALAQSLWAERKTGPDQALRDRIARLLADAQAWYRDAGAGYQSRERALRKWRQENGFEPVATESR